MKPYKLLYGSIARFEDGAKVRYVAGDKLMLTDEDAARMAARIERWPEAANPVVEPVVEIEPEPEPEPEPAKVVKPTVKPHAKVAVKHPLPKRRR